MYGLQDAATRGAIVFTHHHSLITLIHTMWPWVLLGSATAGVLLTQASFRAGRLDWALPPTAAAQPIAGIVIGIALLRDHLAATGFALAFESLCVVAMLGGVLLIGKSRPLKPPKPPETETAAQAQTGADQTSQRSAPAVPWPRDVDAAVVLSTDFSTGTLTLCRCRSAQASTTSSHS